MLQLVYPVWVGMTTLVKYIINIYIYVINMINMCEDFRIV